MDPGKLVQATVAGARPHLPWEEVACARTPSPTPRSCPHRPWPELAAPAPGGGCLRSPKARLRPPLRASTLQPWSELAARAPGIGRLLPAWPELAATGPSGACLLHLWPDPSWPVTHDSGDLWSSCGGEPHCRRVPSSDGELHWCPWIERERAAVVNVVFANKSKNRCSLT
jgi:hypothetical protein